MEPNGDENTVRAYGEGGTAVLNCVAAGVLFKQPTGGLRPSQIHAMAIAIHLSKTDKMDYSYKDDSCRV